MDDTCTCGHARADHTDGGCQAGAEPMSAEEAIFGHDHGCSCRGFVDGELALEARREW